MTATRTRGTQLATEEVRGALIELGLKQEEKPIDGRAYSIRAEPQTAIQLYRDQTGGREPRTFYANGHSFTLAE